MLWRRWRCAGRARLCDATSHAAEVHGGCGRRGWRSELPLNPAFQYKKGLGRTYAIHGNITVLASEESAPALGLLPWIAVGRIVLRCGSRRQPGVTRQESNFAECRSKEAETHSVSESESGGAWENWRWRCCSADYAAWGQRQPQAREELKQYIGRTCAGDTDPGLYLRERQRMFLCGWEAAECVVPRDMEFGVAYIPADRRSTCWRTEGRTSCF